MVNCVSEMQAENVQDFKLKLFVNNYFSCNVVLIIENQILHIEKRVFRFKILRLITLLFTINLKNKQP